ncbi:MAG: hypothetical protein WCE83_11770 [Candidatus Baltobacteraceae bacterium]
MIMRLLTRRRSPIPIAIVSLALACAVLFSWGALPASAQPQSAVASPAAAVTPPPPARSAGLPAWVAFERAWANISSYSATVTTFEQEGTQVQNWVFDYTFHKPSSATAHYNMGPNAGVTAVWNGGDTVVAHRGGFLALFKRSFSLHDPIVTTIRGSSIDQLSFGAILEHGNGTAGTVSESAGPTILSVPTVAVTLVPSSPAADAGLTQEVIDISTLTNLPIRVLGYDGATLVRQIDFSNIRIEH